MLYPFSVAFYRRLGYALVNLNWFLDIPPRHLPDYVERLAVRRATAEDRVAVRACYKRMRRWSAHNGWLARTEWEWENRVWKEGREAVVYDDGGEIEGYLLYTLSWSADARPARVVEWVAATDAAWRGLVGFMASLGEQATVMTYNAPRNEPLLAALKEPYSAVGGSAEFVAYQVARLVSGFLLRVVHLPTALRTRRYPPDVQADLLLRVDDPQIPANSRPLHVHIVDGAASVALANSRFDIETDIATFGQLFVGFISAQQARTLGRLQADDDSCARLTNALSAAPLYMHRSDWF